MAHIKSKWVIVFLIYADFRKSVEDSPTDFLSLTAQMKATLNQMFKDILTVPLPPERVRMYVLLNSLDYKTAAEPGTQSKTLLYAIGNPYGADHNRITRCEVIDGKAPTAGEGNAGEPVQKPELLKKILKESIPVHEDEEVFVVTWDHGSAFGIFREAVTDEAVVLEPIDGNLESYPYLATFWRTAVKKDASLKRVEEERSIKKTFPLLQTAHTVYRIEKTAPERDPASEIKTTALEQDPAAKPDIREQRTVPVLATQKSAETNGSLSLYYSAGIGYEIWKGKPEEESLPSEKIADLQEEGQEILLNRELADVFTFWLGAGRPVGVLLMMNCWMMNLHTMYSLREAVHFLVAPQGDIGTPGYNYKAILRYIFHSGNLFNTSRQLAVKCVETIETKRMRKLSKKLRDDEVDVLDMWKVFAVDLQTEDADGPLLLQQISALSRLVDEINKHVRANPAPADPISVNPQSEAKWMFKYVRSACFDFTEKKCMMVDILNWCISLLYVDEFFTGGARKISTDVSKALGAFRDAVFKGHAFPFVLRSTKGKKVYGPEADSQKTAAVINLSPSGYSLFFPQFSFKKEAPLLENVTDDLLLKERLSNWKDFLKESIDKGIVF